LLEFFGVATFCTVEKTSNHPIMKIEGLIDESCLGLQENREQCRIALRRPSQSPILYRATILALGSWIGLPAGSGSQPRGKKRKKTAVKMLQSFNTRFAGDT
jgi:hypothetical protein